MTLPSKYTPVFDFTAHATQQPMTPLPGDRLSIELQALATFTADLNGFLAQIFNADGTLKDDSIKLHHLADEIPQGIDAATQTFIDNSITSIQALRDQIDLTAQEVENGRSGAAASAAAASAMAAQTASDLAEATLRASEAASAADASVAAATEAENWAKWSEYWANYSKLHEEQSYKWAEYLGGPVEVADPGDPQYNEAVDDGYWSAKWWALRAQQYATGWGVYLNGTQVGTDQQILNFTGTGVSVVVDPDDSKRLKIDIPFIEGTNLGAGPGKVFESRSANQLQFRSLKSSDDSVTITQDADEVDFVFPGATGEANVGANVGGKVALYRDKTTLTLNFRTLESTNGTVTFTQNADTVDLKAPAGDVVGPASVAGAGRLAIFGDASGKLLRDSSGIDETQVARRDTANTFKQSQTIDVSTPASNAWLTLKTAHESAGIFLYGAGGTPDVQSFVIQDVGVDGQLRFSAIKDDGNWLRNPLVLLHNGGAAFGGESVAGLAEGDLAVKRLRLDGQYLDKPINNGAFVETAPGENQTIVAQNATMTPLAVREASGQSWEPFQVQDEVGTVVLAVGAGGTYADVRGQGRLRLRRETNGVDLKQWAAEIITAGSLVFRAQDDGGVNQSTDFTITRGLGVNAPVDVSVGGQSVNDRIRHHGSLIPAQTLYCYGLDQTPNVNIFGTAGVSLTLTDDLGRQKSFPLSTTATVDMSAIAANGRDTVASAGVGWYRIFACGKQDGTLTFQASLGGGVHGKWNDNANVPHADYLYYGIVSYVYVLNGTTYERRRFEQNYKNFATYIVDVLSNVNGNNTWRPVSVASAAPAFSSRIWGYLIANSANPGSSGFLQFLVNTGGQTGARSQTGVRSYAPGGISAAIEGTFMVNVEAGPQIHWFSNDGVGAWQHNIRVTGFEVQ